MLLLDGLKIANEIKQELKEEIKLLNKIPCLAIILVGNNTASEIYVKNKVKACEEVGIKSILIKFDDNISEASLLDKIIEINNDADVDGLIVQMPLPLDISSNKVIETISPSKDVDGFHPINIGKLALNLPAFISATPKGIVEIMKGYGIETEGKNCAIIGRSNIVGKPLSILLSNSTYNATVTLCHSKTENIAEITSKADILIAAMGSPKFVTKEMVKDGAVVIDVGINKIVDNSSKNGYRIVGDVDFDNVAGKCSFITPVPKGIGPMTIVSLLKNTIEAVNN